MVYMLAALWTDDRNKSRLEEINEIIARSQVRAQQMLAAGSAQGVVVTATMTSSAPLVSAAAGQQQTVAPSTPVAQPLPTCSQPASTPTNHDEVTSADNAALTDDCVQ